MLYDDPAPELDFDGKGTSCITGVQLYDVCGRLKRNLNAFQQKQLEVISTRQSTTGSMNEMCIDLINSQLL